MAMYSEFSHEKMVIFHSFVNVYQRVNPGKAEFGLGNDDGPSITTSLLRNLPCGSLAGPELNSSGRKRSTTGSFLLFLLGSIYMFRITGYMFLYQPVDLIGKYFFSNSFCRLGNKVVRSKLQNTSFQLFFSQQNYWEVYVWWESQLFWEKLKQKSILHQPINRAFSRSWFMTTSYGVVPLRF